MNTFKFLLVSSLILLTGMCLAQPNISVWEVDHLSPDPIIAHSGSTHGATLWPCGYDYYIVHEEEGQEQIILHILNDGDQDLIVNPTLNTNTAEFRMNLLGLSGNITIEPNQELQVIIDYIPDEIYSGEGAVLELVSNDPNSPSCNILFNVGFEGPCNTTVEMTLVSAPVLDAGTGNYNTTVEVCFEPDASEVISDFNIEINDGDDEFISFTPTTLPGNNSNPMTQTTELPDDDLRFDVADNTISWLTGSNYCIQLVLESDAMPLYLEYNCSSDLSNCSTSGLLEFNVLPPLSCAGLNTTTSVGGYAGHNVIAPIDLTITDIPTGILDGQIKICSSGDLSGSSEFYNVVNNDDGSTFTFPENIGIGEDCFQRCYYYPISDLDAIIADGEISLTLTPDSDNIGDFCAERGADNNVYVSLEYCVQLEPVPTMGEWGLMSLGLIILIFGITGIKQKSISIAK